MCTSVYAVYIYIYILIILCYILMQWHGLLVQKIILWADFGEYSQIRAKYITKAKKKQKKTLQLLCNQNL